jgi:hypothetical protein
MRFTTLRTTAPLACLLACGCVNLGRQPGDPCDPESHGTESLPIADGAPCPDRATAARLLKLADSEEHLVSVDSDGTREHLPERLRCCYALVGGYSPQSCYAQIGYDAGPLACDDAAAAAQQDGVLVDEGADAAVASGPVEDDQPAQDVCTYSVTTYSELSCSSSLPLRLSPRERR